MIVCKTVVSKYSRIVGLIVIAVFVPLFPAGVKADDGTCSQYHLSFLDQVLETYGAASFVDPAEVAAHKESLIWNALFVIHRCPVVALHHLFKDASATKKWIAELPSIDVKKGDSENYLLWELSIQIAQLPSGSVNAELRLELVTALRARTSSKPQPLRARDAWCNTLIKNLERDWSNPDGGLMAVVNNTTIALASCPVPVLILLQHDQHIFELWMANLDPDVFTPGSNNVVQCRMGADILKSAKNARALPSVSVTADIIAKVVGNEVHDCK